jgi:hypothetical protein
MAIDVPAGEQVAAALPVIAQVAVATVNPLGSALVRLSEAPVFTAFGPALFTVTVYVSGPAPRLKAVAAFVYPEPEYGGLATFTVRLA